MVIKNGYYSANTVGMTHGTHKILALFNLAPIKFVKWLLYECDKQNMTNRVFVINKYQKYYQSNIDTKNRLDWKLFFPIVNKTIFILILIIYKKNKTNFQYILSFYKVNRKKIRYTFRLEFVWRKNKNCAKTQCEHFKPRSLKVTNVTRTINRTRQNKQNGSTSFQRQFCYTDVIVIFDFRVKFLASLKFNC